MRERNVARNERWMAGNERRGRKKSDVMGEKGNKIKNLKEVKEKSERKKNSEWMKVSV